MLILEKGRKVRAPLDRVPANGRTRQLDGKCNRKHTAYNI